MALSLLAGAAAASALVLVAAHQQAAPHVVATLPAEGATIAPGPFTLRVTFDRPMRAGSYSFVIVAPGRYPDCAGTPDQSADGRSFTLVCHAKPGQSYAIGFNSATFRNFVDVADGIPATPHILRFSAP